MLAQWSNGDRSRLLKLELKWDGDCIVESPAAEDSRCAYVDSLRQPLENLRARILRDSRSPAELLDSNAGEASDLIAKSRVGPRSHQRRREVLPRFCEK